MVVVQVDMRKADVSGAKLQECRLQRADLADCTLANTQLQGAHLEGANLAAANLQYANLEGACLRGASLEGANVGAAQFMGADLCGTPLCPSQIRRFILSGALSEPRVHVWFAVQARGVPAAAVGRGEQPRHQLGGSAAGGRARGRCDTHGAGGDTRHAEEPAVQEPDEGRRVHLARG